jgi:hypothetical protein
LGKVVNEARVVPMLYKLTFADVPRPLGMFMGKPLDEQGVKETLETMNLHVDAELQLRQAALDGAFNALWPILAEKLDEIDKHDMFVDPQPRDDREILEEILDAVRWSSQASTLEQQKRHDRGTDIINYRIRQEFGLDVQAINFSNRILLRRIGASKQNEQEKLDKLRAEANLLGINLNFGPEFRNADVPSETGY